MEIFLYGVIGDEGAGTDAATVTRQIRASAEPLDVRINSAGGSVWDGLAIYEALVAHPAPVTVWIDGIAASMASGIAMAARTIIMADSAMMMIHDPESVSGGNSAVLRSDAAKLDKVGSQLAAIYARRSGLAQARVSQMMAAETWFTAAEALAAGLIDQITPPLRLVALADVSALGFVNLPEQLKGHSNMPAPVQAPTPTPPPAVPPRTVAAIGEVRQIVAQARLSDAFALDLAERRLSIDEVRAAVIDELAAKAPNITNFRPVDQTFANPEFHGEAMQEALYCRMSGRQPTGAAAAVMNLTMTDMARELLEHRGIRGVRRMTPTEVFNIASQPGPRQHFAPTNVGQMTTSDFPGLLQGAGQRYLLDVFAAAGSPIKALGRPRSANDFRAITALQLSGAGRLNKVPEGAEIEYDAFKEGAQSYSVSTFAKIFSLSRQALINDDLGAFSDPLRIMGRGAAETEAQELAGLITANGGMGASMSDGNPLYHASHKNKAASGSAVSIASVSAGRLALRSQTDTDGVTPLNGTAKYILAGPQKETEVEQLIAAITATSTDKANPFAGKITPLIDPRITGLSWRLFADPAMLPVIEYAYLNSGVGPAVETRQGWEVLGTEFRVVLDFGCGLVDWRGTYLDPGA